MNCEHEQRYFIELLSLEPASNEAFYIRTPFWIDPEIVVAFTPALVEKDTNATIVHTSVADYLVVGRPVEIAHKLGIRFPDPKIVPDPPPTKPKRVVNRKTVA